MKLFADYKIHNGYKNINIWDIYNGYKSYKNDNYNIDFKEYYKKFYKNRLFSTHKSMKMAMSLVIKHPYGRSFFRYLANVNDEGRLESVSHSTYKDIVQGISILNLVIGKQEIKLYVSNNDIEVGFSANGNYYQADVFIYFYKSEPEEYFYKWKGKLCFEIKNTHAVDKRKIDDCYAEGIPIFEHTISKKLMISDNTSSEEELLNQRCYITEKLTEKIYGKLLSDPQSEEYKLIEKLMKENDELHDRNNQLENYNTLLMDLNRKQSLRIEELENENKKLEYNNKSLLNYQNTIENKKILKLVLKIFGVK